jgi:hypothetical protein
MAPLLSVESEPPKAHAGLLSFAHDLPCEHRHVFPVLKRMTPNHALSDKLGHSPENVVSFCLGLKQAEGIHPPIRADSSGQFRLESLPTGLGKSRTLMHRSDPIWWPRKMPSTFTGSSQNIERLPST